MPMLDLFPRRLPLLWIASAIMYLLLGTIAMKLVGDHAIPTVVLHEALGRHVIELARLRQVVAFDILSVEIVLHNVTVLVTIFAFSLHLLQVSDRGRIVHLVGDSIVELSVPPFVARRDHVLGPQIDFDISCMVAMQLSLFVPRVVELLCHRVKLTRR